jgi:CHAT domain-containing protein
VPPRARRPILNAGAQTVLASLWRVPDAETAELMARFFRKWAAGMGKAAALRSAQRELIAQLRQEKAARRRHAPPLFWAGFVCHGRPQ